MLTNGYSTTYAGTTENRPYIIIGDSRNIASKHVYYRKLLFCYLNVMRRGVMYLFSQGKQNKRSSWNVANLTCSTINSIFQPKEPNSKRILRNE